MYKNFKEYAKANKLTADDLADYLNKNEPSTGAYAGELIDVIEHESEEPEYASMEIEEQVNEFLYDGGYREDEPDYFGNINWVLDEE